MSFESFANKLDKYAKGFKKAVSVAEIKAAQQVKGNIESRVFNQKKDVNGNEIGKYQSNQYKKKRRGKGLQVGTVDLTFTGNLKDSIKLGTLDGNPVVKFKDKFNTNKGRWNEERFKGSKGTIFASSDKGTKVAIEVFEESMNNYLKESFA